MLNGRLSLRSRCAPRPSSAAFLSDPLRLRVLWYCITLADGRAAGRGEAGMVLSSIACSVCSCRFSGDVLKKGNLDSILEFEGVRRWDEDGVGEVSRLL